MRLTRSFIAVFLLCVATSVMWSKPQESAKKERVKAGFDVTSRVARATSYRALAQPDALVRSNVPDPVDVQWTLGQEFFAGNRFSLDAIRARNQDTLWRNQRMLDNVRFNMTAAPTTSRPGFNYRQPDFSKLQRQVENSRLHAQETVFWARNLAAKAVQWELGGSFSGLHIGARATSASGQAALMRIRAQERLQASQEVMRAQLSNRGITVIGHRSEYAAMAKEMGARHFHVPEKIWNSWTKERQMRHWNDFLDKRMRQRDLIVGTANYQETLNVFLRARDRPVGAGYMYELNTFKNQGHRVLFPRR